MNVWRLKLSVEKKIIILTLTHKHKETAGLTHKIKDGLLTVSI